MTNSFSAPFFVVSCSKGLEAVINYFYSVPYTFTVFLD